MTEVTTIPKAKEFLETYLKNSKFYQVTEGELAVDKKGNTIQIDLSPYKSIAEGFVEGRRVIGVVLYGQVFIVPNTPNNYFRLSEVLFKRKGLKIPYLNGEKPVDRNPILEEILWGC